MSKIDLYITKMDFDATRFHPSARWDKSSVYPKVESEFAFKPHMKDMYVESFNNQTFNQDGNKSAILKIKNYNPPDLVFHNLPV